MLIYPKNYTPAAGDVLGWFSVGPGGTKTIASLTGTTVAFTDGTTRDASLLTLISSAVSASVAQFCTVTPGRSNTGSGVVAAAILNPAQWLGKGALDSYTVSFIGLAAAGQQPYSAAVCAISDAQQTAFLSAATRSSPLLWTVANSEGAQLMQGQYGTFTRVASAVGYGNGFDYQNSLNNLVTAPIPNDTLSYAAPASTVINILGLQLTFTGSPAAADTFTVTPGTTRS